MVALFSLFSRNRARRTGGAERRFVKSRRGSAAVEFALVAFPFFLLIMSIIEIGIIGVSSQSLKNGVRDTARLALVGEAQCMDRSEMIETICDNSALLPQCSQRLDLRQSVFPTGWQSNFDEQISAIPEGASEEFQRPQGGDIVVVLAGYRWDLMSPILEPVLGDEEGDFRFRQSFAFQTEAFQVRTCDE